MTTPTEAEVAAKRLEKASSEMGQCPEGAILEVGAEIVRALGRMEVVMRLQTEQLRRIEKLLIDQREKPL